MFRMPQKFRLLTLRVHFNTLLLLKVQFKNINRGLCMVGLLKGAAEVRGSLARASVLNECERTRSINGAVSRFQGYGHYKLLE